MEYDKYNLNSNDVMGTSWKLINKNLGKDHKNHRTQFHFISFHLFRVW